MLQPSADSQSTNAIDWIFNQIDRVVEAYSDPFAANNGTCGYRNRRVVLPDELLAVPGFSELKLGIVEAFDLEDEES